MAQRKGISTGTTAQRSIEEQGKLRFNTTTSLLEYYDGTSWKAIDAPPVVSSVSPSNLLSGDGTGNYTIVVTGNGFSTTVTAVLIASDGSTEITPDTVTRDSVTQVTLVVAKNTANLTNANEPFDVKITNISGLAGTLASALNIDAQPVYSTAAGSLGTFSDSSRSGISVSAVAADPESGGDITYTLESGSLPAGLSLTSTSSGAVISGNATAVGSNTTSNFTIRAKDVNSNISDRAFSITINAPAIESFTSSGTFSVPSGTTAVNVLVVAGGGGGGNHHGAGGGAGGLIYRPAFPVTPGGTVSVTVGDGGATLNNYPAGDNQQGVAGNDGQDSVFGTLTAKGGGGGGAWIAEGGRPGGSGGGHGGPGSASQSENATQPTQPGDSGTYGFGNKGGGVSGDNMGGGGGAGSDGTTGQSTSGGPGGTGKAYTIADGTTSVYYAGGGGGSRYPDNGTGGTGGQGGGGKGGIQNESPGNFPQMIGTANRGGGGGGADRGPGAGGAGAAGGKGIVIVSY